MPYNRSRIYFSQIRSHKLYGIQPKPDVISNATKLGEFWRFYFADKFVLSPDSSMMA